VWLMMLGDTGVIFTLSRATRKINHATIKEAQIKEIANPLLPD
jgi:hypothetical protein